ncbi:MAG: hypothetical protein ACXWMI_06400 [Syntrophales bacterium]
MAFALGIDIGSAASKGIALSEKGVLGSFECPSGGDFKLTAEKVKEELLSQMGVSPRISPGPSPRDLGQNRSSFQMKLSPISSAMEKVFIPFSLL